MNSLLCSGVWVVLCAHHIILPSHSVLADAQFIPNKQLQPKETQIYIKLVKYAMQALDIYQVKPLPHPTYSLSQRLHVTGMSRPLAFEREH